MPHALYLPQRIRIGSGSITEIGQLAVEIGARRPMIITDAFMLSSGLVDRVRSRLEAAGLRVHVFSDTVPDPTTDALDLGLRAVHDHEADVLIGLGGGSSIDTAKALALLAKSGGSMRDYKAPRVNADAALPVIAVPTTAGSGSEATQFTIITDTDNDEKMLCQGPSFMPVAALIDADLTVSMPPRLTADTGIDALTHAIEAYVSRKANPFSDGLAVNAMSTIGLCLDRAYSDGEDISAREAMMLAALQAGIAFSNSSIGLVHGMSRPIGAHFRVAHGLSNAMLLPAVTAFSLAGAPRKYADCARALGVSSPDDSDEVAGANLVAALEEYAFRLDVPTPEKYGISRSDWHRLTPLMAEQALASGSPDNNPVIPTASQIRDLYERIYA